MDKSNGQISKLQDLHICSDIITHSVIFIFWTFFHLSRNNTYFEAPVRISKWLVFLYVAFRENDSCYQVALRPKCLEDWEVMAD